MNDRDPISIPIIVLGVVVGVAAMLVALPDPRWNVGGAALAVSMVALGIYLWRTPYK